MENSGQPIMASSPVSSFDEMLMPIGENSVGEDPRYGDDFTSVKLEIDRLSETDYPKIARLSKRILKKESKDLRVAGYYLLARIFMDGLLGLNEGIQIYYGMLKRFGKSSYPLRDSAKFQAIAWLNNNKLAAFVNKIEIDNEADRGSIVHIKGLIDLLNKEIVLLYGDTVPTWMSINEWIEKSLPTEPVAESKTHSDNSLPVKTIKEVSQELSSELTFARSMEDFLSYLRQNGQLIQLIAMSRALRWSAANIPVNEGGKTNIEPPREVIIAALNSSKDVVGSDEEFLKYESYFMESGCQFYFDLQYHIVKVATMSGRPDIANLIQAYLRVYVEQIPGIINLKYSDGTNFASDKTRQWLKRKEINSHKKNSTLKSDQSSLSNKVDKIIEQLDVAGLQTSIDEVSKIKVKDRSAAFRLDLAKLELCFRQGRSDIALPLALQMEAEVDKYRLHEWDRALALELWDKLLRILKSDNNNEANNELIESLKGKICAMDIGYALRWF